ncbi:MAG: SPOR domain-containing protein [Magnetococcales bacterium]|nr:SPOR domain-containing protein [Magnetococcales bacterium]
MPLGAFRQESKAQAQAQAADWRAKGFDAFVERAAKSDGEAVYAVRVGSHADRQAAESSRQALQAKAPELQGSSPRRPRADPPVVPRPFGMALPNRKTINIIY